MQYRTQCLHDAQYNVHVIMCNDAMMTVLQALIINTPTSGSQLLRTVHVVRANNGAGTCDICTMAHTNKAITSSLTNHTLK